MSITRYPFYLEKQVQLFSAPVAWITNPHQEAHMPVMDIMQKVVMVQTLIVKSTIDVNCSHILEPEIGNKDYNILYSQWRGALKNKKLPVEDKWHNWHSKQTVMLQMINPAAQLKVMTTVTVNLKCWQPHPQIPSEPVTEAEYHSESDLCPMMSP